MMGMTEQDVTNYENTKSKMSPDHDYDDSPPLLLPEEKIVPHQTIFSNFFRYCNVEGQNPFLCSATVIFNFYKKYRCYHVDFSSFLKTLDKYHKSFFLDKVHLHDLRRCQQIQRFELAMDHCLLTLPYMGRKESTDLLKATPDYKFEKYVQIHPDGKFWKEPEIKRIIELVEKEADGYDLQVGSEKLGVSEEMLFAHCKKQKEEENESHLMLVSGAKDLEAFWQEDKIKSLLRKCYGNLCIADAAFEIGASFREMMARVEEFDIEAYNEKMKKKKVTPVMKKMQMYMEDSDDSDDCEYLSARKSNIAAKEAMFKDLDIQKLRWKSKNKTSLNQQKKFVPARKRSARLQKKMLTTNASDLDFERKEINLQSTVVSAQ